MESVNLASVDRESYNEMREFVRLMGPMIKGKSVKCIDYVRDSWTEYFEAVLRSKEV